MIRAVDRHLRALLRRTPKPPAPVDPARAFRAEFDALAADITALHNAAYHPDRGCPEGADGRCTAISRRDTR